MGDVSSDVVDVTEAGVGDGNPGEQSSTPNAAFDDKPMAQGSIVVEDIDPSLLTFTVNGGQSQTGEYGIFILNNDGSFKYVLSNTDEDTQSLKEGEQVSEKFEVTIFDGENYVTHTVTVNVTGTNDIPSLELSDTDLNAYEDTHSSAPNELIGTITSVDPDSGETAQLEFFVDGDAPSAGQQTVPDGLTSSFSDEYGKLTIMPSTEGNNTYVFTLNNESPEVQKLGEGDTLDVSYTIYVKDPNGAWQAETVTVTVHGTNDAPVIEDVTNTVFNLSEAGVGDGDASSQSTTPNAEFGDTPSMGGQLKVTDVDGDSLTFSSAASADNPEGDFGTFSVDQDGNYTFVVNNAEGSAADKLAEGENVTLIYTITVDDGNGGTITQDITININGTNDAPSLELSDTNLIATEDVNSSSPNHIIGTITSADPDNGETSQLEFFVDGDAPSAGQQTVPDGLSSSFSNEYGKLSIMPTTDGKNTYIFELDNSNPDVQALTEGESLDVTYTIYVKDPNGAWQAETVTVTVNGTNDEVSLVLTDTNHTTYDAAVEGVIASGAEPEGASASEAGSFVVDGDDIVQISIGGEDLFNDKGEFIGDTLDPIQGEYGEITNITYDESTGEVNYIYTQTKPFDHDNAKDADGNPIDDKEMGKDAHDYNDDTSAGDKFEIVVTDKDGETANGFITTTIVDDVVDLATTDTHASVESDVTIYTDYDLEFDIYDAKGDLVDNIVADHPWGSVPPGGSFALVGFNPVESSKQVVDVIEYQSTNSDDGIGVSGTMSVTGADSTGSMSVSLLYLPKVGTDDFIDIEGKPIGISSSTTGTVTTYTAEMYGENYFTMTFDSATGNWDFIQEKPFDTSITLKFTTTDADGDTDTQYVNIKGTEEGFTQPSTDPVPEVDPTPDPIPDSGQDPEPKPEPVPDSEPPVKPEDIDIETGNFNDDLSFMDGYDDMYISMGGGVENPYGPTMEYNGEGMTIDTKAGNDDVYMGSGDDTVYLGESHTEGYDNNTLAAQKQDDAQEIMENFMATDASARTVDGAEDSALNISNTSDSYLDIGHGAGGDDTMYGEGGTDILFGGSGNDTLYGGFGNDGLLGGSGDDIIYGDEGDDILDGGLGADKLIGGSGDDLIKFDFQDVFVDGGENSADGDNTDMDVLLTGSDNIDRVKDMLEDGDISNVEVLIAGDVDGKNIDEVLQNSGAQDENGNWKVEDAGSGWTENTTSAPEGYREFSSSDGQDEITILIEATKLEQGI